MFTRGMVNHFNLKMEVEGSCLRYILGYEDGKCSSYKLTVVDKYVNSYYYTIPPVTEEFEIMVRDFFREEYGVESLGFSNTVATIILEN